MLECTRTFLNGGNTGIQRVVRNVVFHSAKLSESLNVSCIPVVWSGNGFIALKKAPKVSPCLPIKILQHIESKKISSETLIDAFQKTKIGRYLETMIISLYHRRKSSKTSQFAVDDDDYSYWLEQISDIIFSFWRYPIEFIFQRVNRFQNGDILLFLDLPWHYYFLHKIKNAATYKKMHIGFVLFDIIPITHTHTCDPHLSKIFCNWLPDVLSVSNFFVTISHSVLKEFEHLLSSEHFVKKQILGGKFRLGGDLGGYQKLYETRPKIESLILNLEKTGFYLSVGTIEPRKNHHHLIDAFEQLWLEGLNVKMVIAGKRGWLCENIIQRIKTHPKYNQSLFWLKDLNDAELSLAYSEANAVICPSIAEGFNLPIVESLRHRTPVFASDIPVHREIGRDFCTYFKLGSPKELSNLLFKHEKMKCILGTKSVFEYEWPDWFSSTRELIQTVLDLTINYK